MGAEKNNAQVNFKHALREVAPPRRLHYEFGFSLRNAEVFASNLDVADRLTPYSWFVRFRQLLGFGDLETMFKALCRHDVHVLEKLHKKRFIPRSQLSRLLKGDRFLNGEIYH